MYGKGGKAGYGWAADPYAPYGAAKGGKKGGGGEEWMFVPDYPPAKGAGKKGKEQWVWVPPEPQPKGDWVFVPHGGSPKGGKGGWDAGWGGKGDPWADPWAAASNPYAPAKGAAKGAASAEKGGAKGGKGAVKAASEVPSGAIKGLPKKKLDARKMFVGALPKGITEMRVAEHFSQFGPIEEVKMMVHPGDGESRGYCFVTWEDAASAEAVYAQYEENILEGQWVDCKPSDGGKAIKAGDWVCPACGDLVFAFRDSCRSCGYSAADGGATPALKGAPKGGKPGDWTCAACGDLNFATREVCRKCGAEKPAGAGKGKGKAAIKAR